MKATFNVTLVHDPGLMALSNMPIYQSKVKDGWKYDHFEKTVTMSTYLAAFAVGDFRYKQTKTDSGIQVWRVTVLSVECLSNLSRAIRINALRARGYICLFLLYWFFQRDFPSKKPRQSIITNKSM